MNLSAILTHDQEALDNRLSPEKRLFLTALHLGKRAIDAQQENRSILTGRRCPLRP